MRGRGEYLMNILRITDGTTIINLLDITTGYSVAGYRQAVAQYKGGGSWSESALSDGRVIRDYHYGNIRELLPVTVGGGTQNATINALADLQTLLTKATDYWVFDWQNEPVWIERRM
ncbi:unnamed protein product, partial [marine sediment metagenome]